MFDEPGCQGNANPKQYLNCFDSCWPVKDAPKSALLEAKYKQEFGKIAIDANSDPFEKLGPWPYGLMNPEDGYQKTYKQVNTRGPEIQLYVNEGEGPGCAQRDMLSRAVIPSGYNASCFDFDDEWSNKVTSMSLRHLEICPFDAELTRRTYWYLLPENIRNENYNWAKMKPEKYPEWAKEDWHPIIAAWQYHAPKFYDELPERLFSTNIDIDDVPKYLAELSLENAGLAGSEEIGRFMSENTDR